MRIKARLSDIKEADGLNCLFFDYYDEKIKVLILEKNIDIQKGEEYLLRVKPTLLYLTKEKTDFENVFEVEIVEIKKGEIMASVLCKFQEDVFEVLMLKENINFDKKAYLCFKSNYVVVER
ncbi:hypothetical protein [Caminibacter sp.]